MPTTQVFSWTIPERGSFDWGVQVGRLFAQIDTTVARVAQQVSGRATVVISAGLPNSASFIPGSAFLVNQWTVLSFGPVGAVEGAFTVQRSGSFMHARVAALEHEGLPIGAGYGYGFRFVVTPSSVVLGSNSVFFSPSRRYLSLIGHTLTASLQVGTYRLQAQVTLTSSTVLDGAARFQLWTPPLTVLMTEVWSA